MPLTPPAETQDHAPGAPGSAPSWTSSAKDMVGCALGPARLWFTLGFGIVNEVYYPRVDIPQIRDLGFIVAGPDGFWSEVKRNANYSLKLLAPGVPAVEIVHSHARYTLTLRITPDPRRDVLLIECRLEPAPAEAGGEGELALYVLVAPHLGATGYDNIAAVERYGTRRVLWAEQGPFGMALAAVDGHQRDAFVRASAGYVGTSDGWQDFATERRDDLAVPHGRAGQCRADRRVAAPRRPGARLRQQRRIGRRPWRYRASCSRSTMCCSSRSPSGRAGRRAVPSAARRRSTCPDAIREQLVVSSIVLRAHLDKTYPGAMVASLSVPWGDTGNERGGYHLVWPRDLVECASALLALGAEAEARDTLRYLIATQNEDGHWNQNQWLGGTPYWQGIQLDEAAFPVLLAAALEERDALRGIAVEDMVRRALGYIARTGPSSAQDRWEENEGINAFTSAVTIAALVAGAALLPAPEQDWALALADFWNAQIEAWTTVSGTALARQYDIPGYYLRVAPPGILAEAGASSAIVPLRNHGDGSRAAGRRADRQ